LSDVFIACSSAVSAMFTNYGIPDDRVVVVHNGIDVEAVENGSAGAAPFHDERPKIGMVAAYDPRKGHDLFIEAAVRIAARFPDARFYLIGGRLASHPESLLFENRMRLLIERHGLSSQFV